MSEKRVGMTAPKGIRPGTLPDFVLEGDKANHEEFRPRFWRNFLDLVALAVAVEFDSEHPQGAIAGGLMRFPTDQLEMNCRLVRYGKPFKNRDGYVYRVAILPDANESPSAPSI